MNYDKVVTQIVELEASRTYWYGATNPILQIEPKTKRPVIRYGVMQKKLSWDEMTTMRPHERFLNIHNHEDVQQFVSIYGPLGLHDVSRRYSRADSMLKVSRLLGAVAQILQQGHSGASGQLRLAVKQYVELSFSTTIGGIDDTHDRSFSRLLNLEKHRTGMSDGGNLTKITDDDFLSIRYSRPPNITADEAGRLITGGSDNAVCAIASSIIRFLRPKQQETMTISGGGDIQASYAFDDLYQFLKWLIWRDAWEKKPVRLCENYAESRESKFCSRYFQTLRSKQKYCCKQCANHATVNRRRRKERDEMLMAAAPLYRRFGNTPKGRERIAKAVNRKVKLKRPIQKDWITRNKDDIENLCN